MRRKQPRVADKRPQPLDDLGLVRQHVQPGGGPGHVVERDAGHFERVASDPAQGRSFVAGVVGRGEAGEDVERLGQRDGVSGHGRDARTTARRLHA